MKNTLCLTALALLVTVAGAAHAQFGRLSDLDPTNKNSAIRKAGRDFDDARLDVMSRSPRAGRDYTKVYFKNGTDATIFVAMKYYPFQVADNTSELKEYVPDAGWETRAWYKLAPGQRVHVGNTHNSYLYFYAEGAGRDWKGKHYFDVRDGNRTRTLGHRMVLLGIDMPEEWTVNITAN